MTALLLALTIGAPVPKEPAWDTLVREWGAPIDPDKDCLFRLNRDVLRITIPGKPHDLAAERTGTNAPRLLRPVTGDFTAGVRVSGTFPTDEKSLVKGREAFYGAGLLIWEDEKNYVRLERARTYDPKSGWRCYPSWELRADGKVVRGGQVGDGTLDEKGPTHLWVNRSGDELLGYFSADGKSWKTLPDLKIKFGKTVKVGVLALQNTAAGYEVELDKLVVTPQNR